MPHVSLVDRESVDDPELEELLSEIEQLEGTFPSHYRAELNFPAYLKTKLRATVTLWQEGELSLPEVQHVGIAISQANDCKNCTGAFCTVLSYGLGVDDEYINRFLRDGKAAVDDERLRAILDYAIRINDRPESVSAAETARLREVGLSDRGIVQLTHLVSDFASWNRANDALDTDYEYDQRWIEAATNDD